MNTLFKDIQYAVRALLKRPGFTGIAVFTLALGIGANTAIFSVINALVLSPPQISDPDRVVAVWPTPKNNHLEGYASYLDLQDWRSRNRTFEDIAGFKPNSFILTSNDMAERIQGMRVTANFFPLIRVGLHRGRNFQAEEEKPGSQLVTIISYEFWQMRFGGNEAVLNSQLTLNNKPHTIIGILPPKFQFPLSVKDADVWTTVVGEGGNLPERGAHVLRAVGRLKPGVPVQQGEADLVNIAANLEQEYPKTNRDETIYV